MTENEGLTPEKFSYTTLDSYLARIVYSDDQDYTVSTLEYGRQLPNGIKAADYLAPLTEDVIYTIVHDEEAPDGEYLVLNFEDIDLRYDFFFMEGKENYIRQVWFNNENELLYKAEFKDENIKASEVMNDFYHELVLRNSLGYTPDDMVGSWAEKIAGRVSRALSARRPKPLYCVNRNPMLLALNLLPRPPKLRQTRENLFRFP